MKDLKDCFEVNEYINSPIINNKMLEIYHLTLMIKKKTIHTFIVKFKDLN